MGDGAEPRNLCQVWRFRVYTVRGSGVLTFFPKLCQIHVSRNPIFYSALKALLQQARTLHMGWFTSAVGACTEQTVTVSWIPLLYCL